jgi:hypothetical protein
MTGTGPAATFAGEGTLRLSVPDRLLVVELCR